MEDSTSKEKILKNIRAALISTSENPFKNVDFSSAIYQKISETPDIQFALNLKESGGRFIYCENENAIAGNLRTLMEQKGWKEIFSLDERIVGLLKEEKFNVKTNLDQYTSGAPGITRCEFLIARFGSVMVSSGLLSGRRMFVYPETHIVLATASQVVVELKEALQGLKKKYFNNLPSQISVITGPSRTADIEKTLVMGAHGPKELIVFLVDDL